ncbi:EscV/YscV/HrcV family type III secretion system export apparatus protein [Acerihabitans arboris]|uniref:EscV/YscV/HrcV family type III secretion system export apparatus protein n=1 Tax=Acerihabitans arboris TaxID=2691583 RepID=A0A845SJL9_9GAMM|nr:EscV/YscV/HrcV family type III secretion system export apparatus protein [Acerihabitans arboris]NDL61525.1 EscV/YscV/HrcV family type III secretion system export apparatus protein [Acerihabitans arboris]
MFTKFLNNIHSRPELLILALVVMIISMLIIPLPTYLLDFLIGLNIVIAMLVFMGAFYIGRILSFSTFPSVLLITTLFRLALTISTARLILTDADAGEIIASFGQFVIADNLVVGFVIFAIVTVVQFIVITKGSERVAEVAARFSLDGMPGKQMSIDADLKAGMIDADGARQRRSDLERESQLYGSFDGAMKFIKGDAIASILVTFVNLIGGMAVGMSQHHMDMSTALNTYTMLTIGDGLVGQIPALLISISAGLIVTRVNGDGDNMGRTIMEQTLGNPVALIITAFLALSIGLLPGFPFPVFVLLAGTLGGVFYLRQRKQRRAEAVAIDSRAGEFQPHHPGGENGMDTRLNIINDLDSVAAETVALILVVSRANYALLEKEQLCERLRSQFFVDYGVKLPEPMLRATENVDDRTVVVLINEIRADAFTIHFDLLRVVNASDEIHHLDIAMRVEKDCIWVERGAQETLLQLGYQLRPAVDEVYHCFAVLMSHHVNEFLGVQETKHMLDLMENKYPDLLKEVLRHATVQRIAEVLQRLLMERISTRNMKLIMESLALWAPREKDVITLVEHVRSSLARYICHKFAINNELRVIVLSAEVEEMIRGGIRNTSSGAFLHLEPAVSDELIDLFTVGLESILIAQKDMVLLTSVDIRRFVKKLIETRFRDLEVMSFGELTEAINVNVIKTI